MLRGCGWQALVRGRKFYILHSFPCVILECPTNIQPDAGNFKEMICMGASTVKWTALDPCSGLGESDPKLCTNFEFYEIETHKHLENI